MGKWNMWMVANLITCGRIVYGVAEKRGELKKEMKIKGDKILIY